jgi:hypothetical protein
VSPRGLAASWLFWTTVVNAWAGTSPPFTVVAAIPTSSPMSTSFSPAVSNATVSPLFSWKPGTFL